MTVHASISSQNRQRRHQLAEEVSEFLTLMPHGRTLLTCTPEGILVYLQMVYLPQHAGTRLPSGQTVAAPSSVANVISHSRMIFKELGRGSFWNAQDHAGNPAAGHSISAWSTGYEKCSYAEGFQTTGAQEITEQKVIQLLTHLAGTALSAAEPAYVQALAARDGFASALLWETGLRGVNARTVRLSECTLPDQPQVSVSVYLRANASASFTHPGILQVKPHHTKTAKQAQPSWHVGSACSPTHPGPLVLVVMQLCHGSNGRSALAGCACQDNSRASSSPTAQIGRQHSSGQRPHVPMKRRSVIQA